MWTLLKVFLAGVASKIWPIFLTYLKSQAAQFIVDIQPIAIKAIESAAKTDLNGDGKYDYAKSEIIAELKAKGIEYKDRWIEQAIEVTYEIWRSKSKAEAGK
jgi:hypothetical protein